MTPVRRIYEQRRRSYLAIVYLVVSLVLPTVLTLLSMASVFAQATSTGDDAFTSKALHPTTIIQQIAEQNMTVPKTPVDNSGVDVGWVDATNGAKGMVPPPVIADPGPGGDTDSIAYLDPNAKSNSGDWGKYWADFVKGYRAGNPGKWLADRLKWMLEYITKQIAPYLAELVIWILNQATYNVNIAAGEPKEVANLVQPVTNIMRSMAIDLLLLLFVLSIWKYWTEGANSGKSNLMGAVGRLIVTALLLMAWSTVSDYIIQISNDMISQILFTGADKSLIDTAMHKLVNFGVAGLTGTILIGYIGPFTFFFLLAVLMIQSLYLLVLKAIQTALLIAQYMFAPIFLVFFATTSTEKIATTFVKSCVEVSLWSFVWIGFLRILVIILGSSWNIYGEIITLIGVLELMLSVPQFIAKAQISPVSELIAGAVAFRLGSKMAGGVQKALGTDGKGLLYKGFDAMFGPKDKEKSKLGNMSNETQEKLDAPRTAANGGTPPFTGPGGAGGPGGGGGGGGGGGTPTTPRPGTPGTGTTPTGTPGTTPTGTPGSTGPGGVPLTPPGARRTPISTAQGSKTAKGEMLDKSISDFFDKFNKGRVQFGTSDSNQTTFGYDEKGINAVNFAQNATEEDKARAIMQAALADKIMNTANGKKAAEAVAGVWHSKPNSSTAKKGDNERWNNLVGSAAVRGAGQYLNRQGADGNQVAQLLQNTNGAFTTDQEAAAIHALTDDQLAHSPFHANYKKTKDAVEQAGLPFNPATAAWAASPEGAKARGQALAAGYQAMESSLRRGLQAQGHTPGTPGYTAALGHAIRNSTTDRQKAAREVGVGLLGTGEAENLTPEEWEAYVNQTEMLANTQGIRPDAAFGAIRGVMATPAAVAHRAGGASLPASIETAARAVAAMKEHRIAAAALGADGFAGSMYTLAANNQLTSQKVFGALRAALAVGYQNYTAADGQDIEQALSHEGEWMAGDFSEGNAAANLALIRQVKGLGGTGNKRECQRVVASGRYNPVGVAAAGREEIRALNPSQAAWAIQAMETDAMDSMEVLGAAGGGASAVGAAASFVRSMPPRVAQGYASMAREGPITPVGADVMEEAVAVNAATHSRMGEVAGRIHRVVNTELDGGGYLNAHTAGVGLQRVISQGFKRETWADPDVLNAVAGFSDDQLGNGGFMANAKHGATILHGANYTPQNIEHLGNIAEAAGVSVGQVSLGGYEAVSRVVAPGSGLAALHAVVTGRQSIHEIVMSNAAADTLGLAGPARDTFVHNAAVLSGNREIDALSGQTYQRAVSLAGGWANAMVVGSGGRADDYLESMSEPVCRVIVAAAETGGNAVMSLSGGDLTGYVRTVGTVARDLGLKDYGQAVEIVQHMATGAGGAIDPGRLPRIIVAEQLLGTVSNSRDARQDVQVLNVVADLASVAANAPRLAELASAAVGAREVFTGAAGTPMAYTPANVVTFANYTRDGGWSGGMSATEYQVIDRYVAPAGIAPTKQIVERIIQFQAVNPGANVTTEHVNLLANNEIARSDMRAVGGAFNLLSAVASSRAALPAGVAGPVDIAEINAQLQAMTQDDVRTILTIERNGGSGGATGQHLLNIVAAVNAVGGGSAAPELIRSVVALPEARLAQPQAAAMIARAAEFSTPGNLANNLQTMTYMVNNCGYELNHIGAADIGRAEQIYGVEVNGEHVVPRREFVTKLVQSGVELTPQNIAIASLPAINSLKSHELPGAVNAVNHYLAAPGPKQFNNVDVLQPESQFLNTLVAVERARDAQQCANVQYVEAQYQGNMNYPPNRNEFTVNVNGQQIRVT